MRSRVVVKGAGELASAVAHRLFRCGFRVVMTDTEHPTAVRRAVSFCSAIPDGEIEVEGVRGVAYRLEQAAILPDSGWPHVPVFIDPAGRIVEVWKPDVIIDARMLKRNSGNSRTDADLVIGLGPGLEAGRDVHYVVETNRGHHLGRIITRGMAAADTGRPGDLAGYTHQRVLRAPGAGRFESRRGIGEMVGVGDTVGTVRGREVRAGVAGVIRGLLPSGLDVTLGQKLGDVDPRGDPSFCHTLSDKARTVSGAVLEIVVAHVNRDARPVS